jgi:deoxycytidine triphosphate deaminase
MLLSDNKILEEKIILDGVDGKVEGVEYSYGLEPCGYTCRLLSTYKMGTIEYKTVNGSIPLQPHLPYILCTYEKLNMSKTVAGRIYCKSSLVRQGLAGFFGAIEPGYRGSISALFINFSDRIIYLKANQGFIQIQFEMIDGVPNSVYGGRYQDSAGITSYKAKKG